MERNTSHRAVARCFGLGLFSNLAPCQPRWQLYGRLEGRKEEGRKARKYIGTISQENIKNQFRQAKICLNSKVIFCYPLLQQSRKCIGKLVSLSILKGSHRRFSSQSVRTLILYTCIPHFMSLSAQFTFYCLCLYRDSLWE